MSRILATLFFLTAAMFSNGQPILPDENTELCPVFDYTNNSLTIVSPGVVRFEIDFGSDDANGYDIPTNGSNAPTKCRVIQNISRKGNSGNEITIGVCYIAFEDQRSVVPKFNVRKISTGALKAYSFPYIRSLKGLSPSLFFPPSTFSLDLCSSTAVPYSFNGALKYKKIGSSTEFGNPIPVYDYSVPAGWKVNNDVSTGPNNPIPANLGATITPDALNNGPIKIRGRQFVCQFTGQFAGQTPSESDYATFTVNRPTLNLKADGQENVSVNCGQIKTVVFTIDNANLATCASFNWTVGSGWLYNGLPTPVTIPTNLSSITLTSIGNAKPDDISVTVTSGSSTFTDVVPVTFTNNRPQLSITGDNTICTDKTYTLSIEAGYTLPTNITWTANPTGMVTLTPGPTANSITATRNGAGGLLTLTASIPALCSGGPATTATTGTIEVGPPSLTQLASSTVFASTTDDPMSVQGQGALWNQACNAATTTVNLGTINSNITWERTFADPTNTTWYASGNSMDFYFWAIGQRAVYKISSANTCGAVSIYLPFESIDCGSEDPCNEYYSLSPNPGRDNVTIIYRIPPPCDLSRTAAERKNTTTAKPVGIQKVLVYDIGGTVKMMRGYRIGTKQASLDVSAMREGLYWIEIIDGKHRERKKLVIKR